MADPRSFAMLAVLELAERAQVSKPTVVRFCRSIGHDGLADFRLKLAGSVNDGVPCVHRAVKDDNEAGDNVVKVIANAVAATLRYRNAAASQHIERAIAALAAAGGRSAQGRRIEFYGVGNSGTVVLNAHKFFRPGVTAAAVSDGHMQWMSATAVKPCDCTLVVSNSVRSHDLLDVADVAR